MKPRAAAKGRKLFSLAAFCLLFIAVSAPVAASADASIYPEKRYRVSTSLLENCTRVEGTLSPILQKGYRWSSDRIVVGSLDVPGRGGINPALQARRDAYVAWKNRRGIEGRSATLDEFEFFRRGNAGRNGLQLYARKSGIGGRALERARRLGVERAWAEEVALLQRGVRGSRAWTAPERIELLATGRVKGYLGHHVNSAAKYPHMASNPANVRFVTWKQHFELHGRNWANPTTGPLIPRN